jgi:two-component system, cell cycle sensor histidine kinase and response regulator CckA
MSSLPHLGDRRTAFAAIVESAIDTIITIDTDQRIIFFNGAAERMFGYSARAMMGESLERLIAPRSRAACCEVIRGLLESGTNVRMMGTASEVCAVRANGDEFSAEASIMKIESGDVTLLTVIVRDLTDRKRAEELSRGQNQVLQLILQNAPVNETLAHLVRMIEAQSKDMLGSVLLVDLAGNCLRHGAAPSLPPDYSRLVEGLQIGPSAGSCGTAAFRRKAVFVTDITTDPLWKPYREIAERFGLRACWSTPIFAGDGRLLGTFAMYYPTPRSPAPGELRLIDIAARFAGIAIERAQTETSLRESEARYRRIFEDAVEGVFQATRDGRLVTANPALACMLGYESPAALLASITDTQRQLYIDAGRRAEFLRLLDSSNVVTGFEFQLRRRDGKIVWVTENAHAVRDSTGHMINYEGTMLEVTERKQLEAQLRQAQKMEALGLLAGGVAHDFNNLLTVINAHADLLLGRGTLDSDARSTIQEIQTAGQRAASLTRQLLAFSRKQVLRTEVVDINQVVRGVTRMLDRVIGENITLELELAPSIPPIVADPGMIEQVLVNLAVNARDAMPAGGVIVIATDTVTLTEPALADKSGARAGDFVRLTLRDTGSGIPAEILPHIFEPFFTTKDPGKGTGLGLATVFGILQQHNGWIDVASPASSGAVFTTYWPAAPELTEVIEPVAAPTAALPGGNETVLLVEDEPAVRLVAGEILRRLGYQIIEAASGNEALDQWQRHRDGIEVLVTDEVMPGSLRGTELAERLIGEKPTLAVVCTSGYTGTVEPPSVSSPRLRYLAKPYTVQSLCATVRQVLDAAG